MNSDLMLFGIEILTCEDIDIAEESIQYNGVAFLINSLSHYNGMTIEVMHDWTIRVWDNEGVILEKFYLIENDEFREKLYGKYPLNK
ncbi:hypothetical protein [Paenibacillus polymyxa]|uniref:hypothetical protein n=1 Tax=Paenibacillus polymyxa TaxID=1406 RepID=UPI002AB599C1|nr:hypothetical protein [Paenibacillus polymyxa]MDY8021206.1 hypothetical protein [Paenibacillus polymyxa]